jgi:Na+/phosphate symporter
MPGGEHMKLANKIDIKSKLTVLHDVTHETGEFIAVMQTAFIYNSLKPLQENRSKAVEYGKEMDRISAIIKEAALDDEGVKPYVPVPEHLSAVWKNLDRLCDLIDKKISEKVLFSDKALNETIYLFQRLVEILRPTADIILARNTFLSRYIQESQANIEKMAVEYATLHENRLITGECLPVASSIYVSMLEAIKSIAWHTKEIAVILGK